MNNDCWMNVFLYLPLKHISSCLITCEQFNEILNGNTYWQPLILQDYGHQTSDNNYKEKYRQFHKLDIFLRKVNPKINIKNKFKEVLNLGHRKLYSIPNEINLLSNINTIYLCGNNIEVFPQGICQMTNLMHIDINLNKLKSLPSDIQQLTKLRNLYLPYNCLETLPSQIGLLTNLRGLNFNHNKLKSLPNEISNLTNLIYLGLNDNPLKSLSFDMTQFKNTKFIVTNDKLKKDIHNDFLHLFN